MKVRELLRLLKEDGWLFKQQKGSHMHFVHPVKPGKVTVPNHGENEDVPPFILASIYRQAGLERHKR